MSDHFRRTAQECQQELRERVGRSEFIDQRFYIKLCKVEDLRVIISGHRVQAHAIVPDVSNPELHRVISGAMWNRREDESAIETAFMAAVHYVFHEVAEQFAQDNHAGQFNPHNWAHDGTGYVNRMLNRLAARLI